MKAATLRELLDYASVRRIAKETEDGVQFTDGSRIECRAEEGAFGGSEVTAPDPPQVAYYIIPAKGRR